MTGPGRGRSPRKPTGFEDVPELSPEEVERRVDMRAGAAPAIPELWPEDAGRQLGERPGASAHDLDDLPIRGGWVPADPVVPGRVTTPTPGDDVAADRADDRRRILWRDSATILIGVIVAILAFQAFLPAASGGPEVSATPFPSGVAVGTLPPPVTLPPSDTFGPIIDPSLGVDATPTPIPVITLGPPTPSPSPSASANPSASIKPTPKPTPKPTKTPAPPTVPPTPAPPTAAFSWSPSVPAPLETVTFSSTSTGATSWDWTFGDGDGSTAENPTHEYLVAGDYTVRLTVSGPGGSDFVERVVTVAVLPPP